MNRHYLLPAIGLLIAANGLAFLATDYPALAPWVGLIGLMAAEKGFKRAASLSKFWLLLGTAVLFSASCAAVFHPLLGLGLGLVLLGHFVRVPFLDTWGANKHWWLDPLICWSGLAVATLGVLQAEGWQRWIFFTFAVFQSFKMVMGFLQIRAIQKFKMGGYAVDAGKPAPDFSLPDETGFPQSLSAFKGRNHVLLIFVRGDWCPSCHITLRSYARNRERFREKNVTLLAVGPDPIGVNKRMVRELGVPFKMLSDEGQRTAMAYGVQMQDPVSRQIVPEGVPLPASFLVDQSGIVRYTSRPERAGEFLNPDTIFPVLAGLAA
jgi:peroxiredoxin